MNSITLKSRAKINLSIDVLGKRQDGYHLVEMIMQTIDLYDIIKIKEIEIDEININSNSSDIPLNENNIVYKAAKVLKDQFNIKNGVEIFIEKKSERKVEFVKEYNMDFMDILLVVGILYGVFIVIYLLATYLVYNLKYTEGRRKVKKYYNGLKKVNAMYEREERLKINNNKDWEA